MKITSKIVTHEDYGETLTIEIDGKVELTFSDGEPEDNCLARNFNDCFGIVDLLEKMWRAGFNTGVQDGAAGKNDLEIANIEIKE